MSMDGMQFQASAKLFDDPNVWIGDTGESSYSTPSSIGFKNVRNAENLDNITDASGNNLNRKCVGYISGTCCDKFG